MKIMKIRDLTFRMETNLGDFIAESEKAYSDGISAVSDSLADNKIDSPIVLISGPSGSGKTTTALRLETNLEHAGINTHTISMDNYFLPLNDPRNERDADGRIDLESPKRLDMDLLNEHLEKLWKCEPIEVPTFDFASQSRKPGSVLQRKEGEMIIMEGIHALNPEITGNIGSHATTVYVSVRTRLQNDDSNLLHPSKIRLMRRIVRDKLFRGRKAEDTLENFKWVQQGEMKFIMPYKPNAQFDIDTFIGYEAAVFRNFVLDEFDAARGTSPLFDEFGDIEEFVGEVDEMDKKFVPANSLIREFVGGSRYVY